jgi:hypothetical protein
VLVVASWVARTTTADRGDCCMLIVVGTGSDPRARRGLSRELLSLAPACCCNMAPRALGGGALRVTRRADLSGSQRRWFRTRAWRGGALLACKQGKQRAVRRGGGGGAKCAGVQLPGSHSPRHGTTPPGRARRAAMPRAQAASQLAAARGAAAGACGQGCVAGGCTCPGWAGGGAQRARPAAPPSRPPSVGGNRARSNPVPHLEPATSRPWPAVTMEATGGRGGASEGQAGQHTAGMGRVSPNPAAQGAPARQPRRLPSGHARASLPLTD